MNEPQDARSTDRRRFLMLMGLACASTAIARPAPALAETRPTETTPPPIADDPSTPSAEARALAEVVRVRFGKDLSDAQIAAITADLDDRLDSGRALRRLGIANGVDPDTTFHA